MLTLIRVSGSSSSSSIPEAKDNYVESF